MKFTVIKEGKDSRITKFGVVDADSHLAAASQFAEEYGEEGSFSVIRGEPEIVDVKKVTHYEANRPVREMMD